MSAADCDLSNHFETGGDLKCIYIYMICFYLGPSSLGILLSYTEMLGECLRSFAEFHRGQWPSSDLGKRETFPTRYPLVN